MMDKCDHTYGKSDCHFKCLDASGGSGTKATMAPCRGGNAYGARDRDWRHPKEDQQIWNICYTNVFRSFPHIEVEGSCEVPFTTPEPADMFTHTSYITPTSNQNLCVDLPDGDSDENPFESMDGSDGETLEHQTSPAGSAKSPASGAIPKSRVLAASPRRSVASVKEKPLEPSELRKANKVMRTKNVRAQKGLPRPDARGPPAKASVHARMSSILA